VYSFGMAKAKHTSKQKKPAKTKPAAAKAAPKKTAAPTKLAAVEQPQPLAPEPTAATVSSFSFRRLQNWNGWLAAVHAVQGIAVLLLGASHTSPVTTSYLTPDPIATKIAGHPVLVTATKHVFDVNVVLVVALFFFLSALAHAVVATVYRPQYEADLKRGINKARWIEYALSASTMMIAIGFLSGITDLATFIAIFALDVVMNLMGLAMEVYNQGKPRPNWLAYGVGTFAGIVPWIVFALYVFGANAYGSGRVPGFVYWIYASIFACFSAFAVNMYLQYKRKGRWADYLYGERVYMVLSLVAKTALAWQVFAGVLRP